MSERVRFFKLVFPADLYPRQETDAGQVAHLRDVLEAGGQLPPILIDATDRVVDGWHRAQAHRLLHGDAALIPFERREYIDDAAFVLDAIRLNAAHGKPLTDGDREHIAALAGRSGITVDQLACVLGVTSLKVQRLSQTTSVRARIVDSHAQAGRAPLGHVRTHPSNAGEKWQAPTSDRGIAAVNSVIIQLRSGEIDPSDVTVRTALESLVRELALKLRKAA